MNLVSSFTHYITPQNVIPLLITVAVVVLNKKKEDEAPKSFLHQSFFRLKAAFIATIRHADKLVGDRQDVFLKRSTIVNSVTTLALLVSQIGSLLGQENLLLKDRGIESVVQLLWVASSVVLATTLAVMSRSADSAVRDWIFGYALMSVCLVLLVQWIAPTAPVLGFLLKNPVVSRGVFSKVAGSISLSNIKNICSGSALIANRFGSKNNSFLKRSIGYYAYVWPNVCGFLWSCYISWSLGVAYGYDGYLHYLTEQAPGRDAGVSSKMVCLILALSTQCLLYAAVLGTWRTQGKVSRGLELNGHIALSVVATAANAYAVWQGLYPLPNLPKMLRV